MYKEHVHHFSIYEEQAHHFSDYIEMREIVRFLKKKTKIATF